MYDDRLYIVISDDVDFRMSYNNPKRVDHSSESKRFSHQYHCKRRVWDGTNIIGTDESVLSEVKKYIELIR